MRVVVRWGLAAPQQLETAGSTVKRGWLLPLGGSAQTGEDRVSVDGPVLGAIGVSGDEEHVYRTLLEHPGLNTTELRARVEFGSSRLRSALTALERKAMITRRGGTPARFRPTPPDIVVDTLVAQREEELRQVRLAGMGLMELLRHPPEQAQVADIVEILDTREATTERWLQLQGATREHLEVLVRPPYGQRRLSDDEAIQRELLQRGVITRGIYDQNALERPELLNHIRAMGELGEQARVVSNVPVKMALFDRKVALVPLTQPDPASAVDAALVVHESALLDALLSLFDSIWQRGTPAAFGAATTSRPADEDAVLTLLAGGLKDEAVARQLGVSTNTVRRRISAVLTRLGVTTRFQAGLALSREGWPRSESDPSGP